jgi:hypothetical protein
MDISGVDVKKVIATAVAHESIQYIIYNRKITSRSWGLGTWRPYTGSSPHTEHVHFNTRKSHENSNKPWFMEEETVVAALEGKDLQKVTALNTRIEGTVAMDTEHPINWDQPDVPGNKEQNELVKTVLRIDANAALAADNAKKARTDILAKLEENTNAIIAAMESIPEAVVSALSEGPTANLALLLKANMPADKWLQFVSDISALDEE